MVSFLNKYVFTFILIILCVAIFVVMNVFTQTSAQSNDDAKLDDEKSLTPQICHQMFFENKKYSVCKTNPVSNVIALFLNDADGQPYKYFRNVERTLQKDGLTFAFAMNAGMYHQDYTPVGLYIENGKELSPISTAVGPGNFHMKPNGVFFIKNNKAGVLDTESYVKQNIQPDLATQSGPMLLVDNQVHPRFIIDSPYLQYRNAVGVDKQGNAYFVISEDKVNFEEMARFFRDELHTPNALYLDGSISSFHSSELKRYDWLHALGPIIGVVIENPK